MPVDPEQLDDLAANVAAIYREAETALVRIIARYLAGELDSELPAPAWVEQKLAAIGALRRSAQAVIAALSAASGGAVRDAAAAAFRAGWDSALAELPAQWFPASGLADAAKAAAEQVPGFAAVEALAAAVTSDIGEKARNILRDVVDAYRDVITGAAARTVTGVQTRRQAAQAAWRALSDRGITGFTDRAGRRWQLSTYVEMATRTVTQRAAVQGQTDRLHAAGVGLVMVSNAPQECRLCRPFEGRVLSLDGSTGELEVPHELTGEPVRVDVVATLAEAQLRGLFHPNCRHSVSAYLPGVSKLPPQPTADPEGDKARQRQRALERKIRKAKLAEAGALDEPARKAAAAQVRAAQAELRQHLADHPELRRLRYREQIGAGNIPPSGGGDAAGPIGPITQPTLDGGPVGAAPAPAPRDDEGQAQAQPVDPNQLDLLGSPGRVADALAAGRVSPDDLTVDELRAADRVLTDRAAQLGREGKVSPAHQAVRDELGARTAEATPEAPAPAPRPGDSTLGQLLDINDELTERNLLDQLASGSGDEAARAEWAAAYERFLDLADAGEQKPAHARFLKNLAKHPDPGKLVRRRLGQLRDDELRAATLRAYWQELANRAKRRPRGIRDGRRFRSNTEAVEWAREGLPLPELAAEQRAAVTAYTGSDYQLINDGLRGFRKPSGEIAQQRFDRLVRNIDAAFERASLPEALIVHRATGQGMAKSFGADVSKPETMQALVGKVFTEPGYMSTSIGRRAAFTGNIYFMFRVPEGYPAINAMPISRYDEKEREIILKRDSRFLVHAAYQRGYDWFIEAEVLSDAWVPDADWQPDPYGDAWEGYQ